MVLASIPCGLMEDLLSIDYGKLENIRLIGVDLGTEFIILGEYNAKKYNKEKCALFIKKRLEIKNKGKI